jgi:bacterioferritin-associated ferredoxin
MLICHCQNVSDRQIRAAVQTGATTREDVGQVCGAAKLCGGCSEAVDEVIAAEQVRMVMRLEPAATLLAAG